jgi:ubiquinone/menaquinone biosynthesis C-methylase UbiE
MAAAGYTGKGSRPQIQAQERLMSDKKLIQAEFGQNAQSYVESKTHRLGASLARLLELIPAEPQWQVLDVAAAVGYTAYAFAPHVAHVWVTDITTEMLALARQEAADRGLVNVTVEVADAEALPYEENRFDLVTCRIAPHHFGDIPRFVREAARVLRPGGRLAVVDNVVPNGPGGDYVNAFEKLRDPSHNRCLSLDEWLAAFQAAGLTVIHQETLTKEIPFEFWAKRHNSHTQQFLRTMLSHAPEEAADFFRPESRDGQSFFHLQEGILISRKGS